MPQVEEMSGSQPPIELLRDIVDHGYFYDRPGFKKVEIEKFTMICAAAPPSGGRSPLTPRFMHHFQVINVPDAEEETLMKIFEEILGGFFTLKHFDEKIKKSVAVQATIEMYNYI